MKVIGAIPCGLGGSGGAVKGFVGEDMTWVLVNKIAVGAGLTAVPGPGLRRGRDGVKF